MMRTSLVEHVVARCQEDGGPWTPVQAEKFIAYFDKYWHYNSSVREAFIDDMFLVLKLERNCQYVASTGSLEGSHKNWDAVLMGGMQNKSVRNVVKRIAGISPDGSSCPGYFNDEHNRFLSGQRVQHSIDARQRSMKAMLRFLRCSDGASCTAVSFVSETLALVQCFDDKSLKRHAVSQAHRPLSGLPAVLGGMRKALRHGLEGSPDVTPDASCYPVHRRTGRCGCPSSIKHGVCSSRSVCKHAILVGLCERASASASAFLEVERECVASLLAFVTHRERSKPKDGGFRCMPLYTCTNKVQLLSALSLHSSVPPTGTSTGVEQGVMQQPSVDDREYSCTFGAGHDLGLVLAPVCETGCNIMVLCYSATEGGAREGPAAHVGDRIVPGDEIFFVTGVAGVLADALSEEGVLIVLQAAASEPLKMSFCRPALGSIKRDAGGRPCEKQAKFRRLALMIARRLVLCTHAHGMAVAFAVRVCS